jgi:hypothetical protein
MNLMIMNEYWRIAEAEAPLLIDSPKKLEDAADIISKAIVVGLDCEWPPSETGHRPAATVVQLACLIEPSQDLVVLVLVRNIIIPFQNAPNLNLFIFITDEIPGFARP